MKKYDVIILTDKRYVNPSILNPYIKNVLLEDRLVQEALERKGLKVWRTNWDNPLVDWSSTSAVLFRTTWDYFDRYTEFRTWLDDVKMKTKLINNVELIDWNIDKHYLLNLDKKGVAIPPTIIIEKGDRRTLKDLYDSQNWKEVILKPAISGAARHTYHLNKNNITAQERVYKELIQNEAMLLQEYQYSIKEKGEISLMLFGGQFSHAILKRAKVGDFRVQDDFGGTVHPYQANEKEIEFAEKAILACPSLPIYARVDVMWDNNSDLCVSELEMIEPELWFRMNDKAADKLAEAILKTKD